MEQNSAGFFPSAQPDCGKEENQRAGGRIHDSFGLHGVLALIVLDREGRVRLTQMGDNSAETSFHRDLVQFLNSL